MSFKGKAILVTGGSSGIGAATALQFATEGANVAIVGRNENRLRDVAEEICKVGNKPLVILADLTKDEDVKRIIDETIKGLGSIDVLINGAGVANVTSLFDDNLMQTYETVFSTNLRSHILLTHTAVPHLVASKGNIVNISSMGGSYPVAGRFAYCSSKAAFDMLTKCTAGDLGGKGVRINSVLRGPVVTSIKGDLAVPKEQLDAFWQMDKKHTSLLKVSQPNDVANLVLFLASDKASAITGSLYSCDYGTYVKL